MSALTLAAELIRIDSVNPGLVPGAAGESAIADYLRARLVRTGFATHLVDAAAGRPSLVAVAPGRADRPTVILNGHLDTVGVAGMCAPFTPTLAGDRLSGRGAAAWRDQRRTADSSRTGWVPNVIQHPMVGVGRLAWRGYAGWRRAD